MSGMRLMPGNHITQMRVGHKDVPAFCYIIGAGAFICQKEALVQEGDCRRTELCYLSANWTVLTNICSLARLEQ